LTRVSDFSISDRALKVGPAIQREIRRMSFLQRILRLGRACADLGWYALRRGGGSNGERKPTVVQRSPGGLRAATILIVEAELPRPDRDAGSRILEQLLRSLVDMGLRVYLMPAAADTDAVCIARLKEIGVQPIPAPQSKADWRRLQTLAGALDFVWLCRPLVAVRFLDFFRRHSTAQVQYYAVDLHYVREARRYQLTGRWSHWLRSRLYQAIERSVIARSDAVLCLSHEELTILSGVVPQSKLRWVPPHVSQQKAEPELAIRSGASNPDVIFVGNFRHPPNADAMQWLLHEVWPRVRQALPAARLQIVGANPPLWLAGMHSTHVQLHDGVTDVELTTLYRQAAVAVAPLRFGAGVKGKVLEAMEQGVPLVSTSIGLEGLPGSSALPAPCDDAATFATAIVQLVDEQRHALDVARRQREYLSQHFSPSSVREQLVNVLAGSTAQGTGIRRPTRLATASV
jgi:glycosyltransferase involved in cell wall biosynthesis